MASCPRCNPKRKKSVKIIDFFPELNYLNCYNCKKRFIWIDLLCKKYFIQKKSLLK